MEKILIIDDNTTIRSFLSEMLRPLGYAVSTASDGRRGLDKALTERPDLILLDFNLPRLSGVEILEALQKENYEVPVILMTAHGSESVAVQAFRLGVRDYLTKPFEAQRIIEVIEKALTESRLRRERDQLMQRLGQTNRQLERRLMDLSTLYAVGQSVTSLLDLEKLLNRVVEAAAYLTGADEAFLFLAEEGKDELSLRDSRGLSEKWVPGSRLKIQDTLIGTVVTTGKPLVLDSITESRELKTLDHPVSALVNVPLKVKEKTIGVLGVTSKRPGRAFARDDLSRLAALADYAVIAIENARLYERARQRAGELGTINEIAQTITSSLDLDKVIRSVMKGINRILRVETGSLLLIDEETNELVFKITLQGDTEKLAPYRLKMGQGIAGWVAQRGEPLLVPDVQLDPRHYRVIDESVGFTSHAIMCVPLTVKEKVIGVIEVINKLGGTSPDSEAQFSENDLELLSSMAAPVAIAIENARLHEATQKLVAAEILQQTVVTVAHYINNPLTALAMSAHSLTASAEQGKVICHDDFLSEAARLTEKKVEEIAAVIGILKEMASPKSTIYLGETKMIDIREQLAERLKAIEEKYKK
ncbi:MAG: GAF domain-containing protein [Anaerolineae bacterium]|nr:GAF domain-containing protein [Anaerolineae bacterium]